MALSASAPVLGFDIFMDTNFQNRIESTGTCLFIGAVYGIFVYPVHKGVGVRPNVQRVVHIGNRLDMGMLWVIPIEAC